MPEAGVNWVKSDFLPENVHDLVSRFQVSFWQCQLACSAKLTQAWVSSSFTTTPGRTHTIASCVPTCTPSAKHHSDRRHSDNGQNKNRAKVYAWQHLWLQRGLSCIDFPGIPPHLCSHAKPWLKLHRWLKVGSPRSERTSMAQHAKKNVSLLPPSDSTPLKLRVLHLCAAWNPNERGHRNALDMTKTNKGYKSQVRLFCLDQAKPPVLQQRRHFVLYGNQSQIRDWISGSLGSLSLNSLAFAIQ